MSEPTAVVAGPSPQDEVIDLCRDLIRIDSSNYGDGSGPGERKAAEYAATLLDEVGIESRLYEPEPGRTSLVARWGGGDGRAPMATAAARKIRKNYQFDAHNRIDRNSEQGIISANATLSFPDVDQSTSLRTPSSMRRLFLPAGPGIPGRRNESAKAQKEPTVTAVM